ncbi:PIR protein, partial [Plasmodium vivax]
MAAGQSHHLGASSQIYTVDLQSKIIDNNLEINHRDLSNYNKKCSITFAKTNNEKLKEICQKTLRFIETSPLWTIRDTPYDLCLQVNYWLYYKIGSILGFDDNALIETTFAGYQLAGDNIMGTRSKGTYNERCKPDFDIFKEKDWDKRKKLYEYYVDYDTLFRTAEAFPPQCEEYYDKFKEIISVYKYFEEKCLLQDYKCPKHFDKFKNKNPVSKLENLSCYKQLDKQKTATSMARLPEEGDTSPHSPGPKVGHLDVQGASGLQGDAGSTQDTQLSPESSDIRTKVTNSVLGAAPVLLTATMLYRYTPLGPWMRRLGGSRTNNINAMDTFSPYA